MGGADISAGCALRSRAISCSGDAAVPAGEFFIVGPQDCAIATSPTAICGPRHASILRLFLKILGVRSLDSRAAILVLAGGGGCGGMPSVHGAAGRGGPELLPVPVHIPNLRLLLAQDQE